MTRFAARFHFVLLFALVLAVVCGTALGSSTNTLARPLPERTDTLIRNAYIVTMDPLLGDLRETDILVRDGRIERIGKNLETGSGVDTFDASGLIIMPGLIDTHWHMWTTLIRGSMGNQAGQGYFDVVHRKAAPQFTADDEYLGVMLAGAEAIDSGITFVHNWAHNLRTPEHARASLQALNDLGLRARFSYGYHATLAPAQRSNLDDVALLQKNWATHNRRGLIDLGVAVRGPLPGIPQEVWEAEIRSAQQLGLPVTVHVNQVLRNQAMIQKLCDAGLMNRDVMLVHAIQITDDELDCIAKRRAAVSLSPESEMRIGYGFPRISELLAKQVRIGLSVDTVALTGGGNLFSVMRTTQNIVNALRQDEFAMPARQVLELATIRGAEALGMDKMIGSIAPGKRADMLFIDPKGINLIPVSDVANILVQAVQPANIWAVMVDGRFLKQNNVVTIVDHGALAAASELRNTAIMRGPAKADDLKKQ